MRRSRDAERPRDPGNRPYRNAPRLALLQLRSTQTHAKLRAAGQSRWESDGSRAQRAQGGLRRVRYTGTLWAILQMRIEPRALLLRQSFYVMLRNHSLSSHVHFLLVRVLADKGHAAPPCITARRASNPRYRRVFTVETGKFITLAIS